MMTISFDFEKLSKRDQALYGAMNDSEKQNFEKTWIQIETLKQRQVQQKNMSRERVAKEKRVLAEKERKERAHRLIERGAILEAYLAKPLDFSNDDIKELISAIFNDDGVKRYIEEFRASRSVVSSDSLISEDSAYPVDEDFYSYS